MAALRSHCCHSLFSFASFDRKPTLPFPFLSLTGRPFFGGRRPRAGPFRRLLAAQDPRPSNESDLELLLHNKPSPVRSDDNDPRKPPDSDDALAPFLKFFKARDSAEEGLIGSGEGSIAEAAAEAEAEVEDNDPRKPPNSDEALAPFLKFFRARAEEDLIGSGEGSDAESAAEAETEVEEKERVEVQYYEPKPGDLVVGVVVSGNENRLDVNVGADMLGTMLTKEVLPLYEAELPYLLCDRDKDAAEYTVPGKMGILKDEEALSGGKVAGRSVVEAGTILFAEVLGRTLSGRPLLSTRRMFRRVAWHRVRQVLYAYSFWNDSCHITLVLLDGIAGR
ncbi:hypothetical protein BHM03_00005965 [Ensete ventricosum]|nr:hypothetical protein BHM03_00005965 [Ensete ventricosum]